MVIYRLNILVVSALFSVSKKVSIITLISRASVILVWIVMKAKKIAFQKNPTQKIIGEYNLD